MLRLKAYRDAADRQLTVPAGEGRAFRVHLGEFLTVTDVAGGQVGAFFAFAAHDLREFLSPHNTRLTAGAAVPPVGTRLVSNRRQTMLTLVRDAVGRHDLLLPACDAARLTPQVHQKSWAHPRERSGATMLVAFSAVRMAQGE